MANVSVVGAGYVGLVTAVCLAELGHSVTCIEKDPARLKQLEDGDMPFFEPGLKGLASSHHSHSRLTFTDDYTTAVPGADFVFIAVNTPSMDDGSANVEYVFESVLRAARVASQANVAPPIVLKSTVPVGTSDLLAEVLNRQGYGLPIVSNPEFLREGSAIKDFLEPDRLVIGASDPAVADAVASLFSGVSAPVFRCSSRSAEMAKYASNALLATRISFMNEIAGICRTVDADVDEVAAVVGADRRIGPHYLKAGLGWGGSCFPKDMLALRAMAWQSGRDVPVIEAAVETNVRQREEALQRILQRVAHQQPPVVCVLGLSFKPNTDDLRESPSLDIIRHLTAKGVQVRAHDPVASLETSAQGPVFECFMTPYEAALGADLVFLATEWDDYLAMDWSQIRASMRGSHVLDGRNVLDAPSLIEKGFIYEAFGRREPQSKQAQTRMSVVPTDFEAPEERAA